MTEVVGSISVMILILVFLNDGEDFGQRDFVEIEGDAGGGKEPVSKRAEKAECGQAEQEG